ncbi:trypsin-like peptidase domain-containing protein [Sphingobium sp. WW5]|uniref:trypsin-like peptidase domain-containing protein n=1 Tax=unclassified Sphingobium TaxID=2611147 RepID=UPI003C19B8DE
MIDAIPLICRTPLHPDDLKGGSGFLFSGDNGKWIVTAAHNAIGAKADEDYSRWANKITVFAVEEMGFTLSLFEDGEPTFNHIAPIDGVKPDMIAISAPEDWFNKCAETFRVFTKSDVGSVADGDNVTAWGYAADAPSWPTLSSVTGKATLGTFRVFFDADLKGGFSGGPLLNDDRKLVGLVDSADAGSRGYSYDAAFVVGALRL